ncbi:MAG: hypothetical protein ACXQS5_04850 [Candidatus Methanospirareceae archaeon]
MRDKFGLMALAILFAITTVVSCVAVYSSTPTNLEDEISQGSERNVISLTLPSFIGLASATEAISIGGAAAPRAGTTFLEEEAGISAYTNVGQEIDLEKAKEVYRTIEIEKENYTIGSVALSGYSESEDVHVYVHRDGWIVAYYLDDEPMAKMIDYKDYEGNEVNTKLADALIKMCDGTGVPLIYTNFYDFRYPNANKLMIIAEGKWEEGTDKFDLKIPSDFIIYDRSWYHGSWDSEGSNLKLDGNEISSFGYCNNCWSARYGKLTPTQLKPDEFHTVKVWHDEGHSHNCYGHACAAIVLAYREA